MNLLEKIYQYIQINNMIRPHDKVLVAVSGGPDSVALLHILNHLKERLKISLHAAHLNHMLRGEESRADAQFVRELCRQWEIPCTDAAIDVPRYQKEQGLSCEAAAREVRYRFLLETASQCQAQRIALGHHADDQAETILLNLLRGAGSRGLSGISPVRDGIYIRPLLEVRRGDIEKYCRENHLSYRIDSTNRKAIYQRNKIRMHLIPWLEKEYNPEIVLALGRLANLLREEDRLLEKQANDALKLLTVFDEQDIILKQELFINLPLALQRRVIRRAWEKLVGSKRNLSFEHVEAIINMANQRSPNTVELPEGINCQIAYSKIKFQKRSNRQEVADYCYPIKIPGVTRLHELGLAITAKLYHADEIKVNPADLPANEALLDYSKTGPELFARKRKKGDKFYPYGATGAVKLKKFFINQKVPREKRDLIPLICKDNQIVWVGGLRIGEYWKVTEQTKVLLHLRLEKTNHDI